MDFCLHKAEFISGVLVTKKIGNLLILYIAKTEATLDINLSSIKLHELCEFDQKKITCRITLISLFLKLNTLKLLSCS